MFVVIYLCILLILLHAVLIIKIKEVYNNLRVVKQVIILLHIQMKWLYQKYT